MTPPSRPPGSADQTRTHPPAKRNRGSSAPVPPDARGRQSPVSPAGSCVEVTTGTARGAFTLHIYQTIADGTASAVGLDPHGPASAGGRHMSEATAPARD